MIKFDLLLKIYITYDDSLTNITTITGDLVKTWKDYVAGTGYAVEFDDFKKFFITLDDLPYMLSIEDFEYSDYINHLIFDEILIAQWMDQIKKHDGMLEVGEDICLEFSKNIDIWIYRQNKEAFEYSVNYDLEVLADSGIDQFQSFEDALRDALSEIENSAFGWL